MIACRLRRNDFAFLVVISILLLVVALATGHRPVHVGSDTALYWAIYDEALNGQELSHRFEFLYDFLSSLFAFFSLNKGIYFSFLSALSLSLFFLSFTNFNRYFSRSPCDAGLFVYGFLLLITSTIFYAAQVNVIRQGISCAALFCFYSCLLTRRYGFTLFFSAFVALGFHFTAIFFILLSFCLALSYRSVLSGTLVLFLLYTSGATIQFVTLTSSLSGIDFFGKITEYGAGLEYTSGIRLDFAFFSLCLGGLLDIFGRFLVPSRQRERFLNSVKIYWLLLIPFLIFGFGAFSDRLLLNAWLYFSIVLGIFFGYFFLLGLEFRIIGLTLLVLAVIFYSISVQGLVKF